MVGSRVKTAPYTSAERLRPTHIFNFFYYEFGEKLYSHAKLDIVLISFTLWNGVAKDYAFDRITMASHLHILRAAEGQGGRNQDGRQGKRTGAQLYGGQAGVWH